MVVELYPERVTIIILPWIGSRFVIETILTHRIVIAPKEGLVTCNGLLMGVFTGHSLLVGYTGYVISRELPYS